MGFPFFNMDEYQSSFCIYCVGLMVKNVRFPLVDHSSNLEGGRVCKPP
jgi:hypothetical protein